VKNICKNVISFHKVVRLHKSCQEA